MSSNSSSKKCNRRSSRDLNRTRLNLNVDLNSPPAEAGPAESSQHPPPSVPPPAAAEEGGGAGAVEAPIDLEASDDELQLLSSPRGFPPVRNQSRKRNRPVILVVDEELEIHTGTSGVHIDGRDDHITKTMKTSKVAPPSPPKEPTFSCPICMGTLVSPCSTVCGHIFCEGCIKAAVQLKKICPTCRRKLTMKNNFHKVFLPTTTND